MTQKIIGITGLIGSGKDTAADYLVRFHGFHRVSFAGALKDAVAAIFGWSRDMLEGQSPESRLWREQVDQWWSQRLNMPQLTPRWVLQNVGTEVFRNHFHPDIWVASVENRIRQYQRVVITDTRFENEIQAVRAIGGQTLRISRGPDPEWVKVAREQGISACALQFPQIHASEYSSAVMTHDHYVDNNGTLEQLYSKLEVIVLRPVAELKDYQKKILQAAKEDLLNTR